MMNELRIRATHQGGMRVLAGDETHQVVMDYPAEPAAPVDGLTPLQMLLASLAACSANSVATLLSRRMKQHITGLEVEARATRSEQHPTVLTCIWLEFFVKGPQVNPQSVAESLKFSEERICPVWNMLKSQTPIEASFRVIEEPAHVRQLEPEPASLG